MTTEAPAVEQPEFVDEIVVQLQRADPGEIESAELEELTGADPDGLRMAIEWMREQDLFDDDAEHFKLRDASALPQHEAPPEEQLDSPTGGPPTPRPPAPGEVPVRLRLGLTATYGRGPGENDDAIVAKSETLFTDIQEALGQAFPNLDIFLTVEGIETYDSPRVIFPPEG